MRRAPSIFRGLRFRLTVTNAILLTVLLVVVGFFFRQLLNRVLENHSRAVLEEEWGAVKGYLRIFRDEPQWMYDRTDDEETLIVKRLQQVFLLADAQGKPLSFSWFYEDVGANSPAQIKEVLASNLPFWEVRTSSEGEPYQIRGGLFVDNDKRYFVAIGHSLAQNQKLVAEFTRDYFTILPVMIVVGVLVGWFVAARAVKPVNELALAAERISGTNLSLRIPPRHSGDELDDLIQTFNSMVERLEQSFEMTRRFSSDVSHELRTPLTAIRGQLEVALFTADTTDAYREAIINALQDVERLGQTIRAMLLLSQAESGQVVLQKSTLDLCPIVEDIVDQFQIPAEEAQVTMTAEVNQPCRIEGDRIQIERLISNLLSNALKYTQPGGKVLVRAFIENNEAIFEVEDTGVGIPPDHLPHIFDRFYRVPGNKEKQGLGLGLSFVAWIVKAHGGRVDVQSAVGAGSKFRISLPANVSEPELANQPAA